MELEPDLTDREIAASGCLTALETRDIHHANHLCEQVADIDAVVAQALVDYIGGEARLVRLDVTQEADRTAAMDGLDRLDVLVNNAGVTILGSIEDVTLEQFRREFEIDVVGVFLGSRQVEEARQRCDSHAHS